MSKTIDIIQVSNDTFSDVFTIVSLLANAFTTTVTVSSNSTGETTTGNGFVVGTFGSNTLVASTIRGGNVSTSNTLVVSSNLTLNGSSTRINSNLDVVAASVNVSTNSTITVLSVQSNSSASWATVGGTFINVTANLILSGRGLKIPTGNSSSRPSSPSSGFIRFNDETSLLEMYVGSDWQSFVAYTNTFTASAVNFVNSVSISATNVQAAIEELDSEKLNLTGGTLTGNVTVNRNGISLPTPTSGAVLQVGQSDGVNNVIELVSFDTPTSILGRRSAGGNGSRSAVSNNDVLFKTAGSGYDGSSFPGESVSIQLVAAGAHNTSSKPTKVLVQVTPTGSNTPITVLTVDSNTVTVNASFVANSGTLSSLTANAITVNNLTVNANLVANGALLTTLNASAISNGTVASARLPAANTTANGAVALANTSEFTTGQSNTKVLTPGQVFGAAAEVTLTYSGNTVVTTGDAGLDMSDFINGVITLTQISTLGQPLNVKVGQSGCIRIVQDATGLWTLSFNADWEFAGGTAPTISSAAGTTDLLFYHVLASGRVFGSLVRAVA